MSGVIFNSYYFVRDKVVLALLSASVLVYGVSGDPTPEEVSPAVIAQGALLVLSVAYAYGFGRLEYSVNLFSSFFWSALVIGLMQSIYHDLGDVVRDLIAHLFIGFSAILLLRADKNFTSVLVFVCSIAGGLISFRFLQVVGFSPSALQYQGKFTFDDFLKLNTDPLVTFASCMGGIALFDVRKNIILRAIFIATGMTAAAVIGFSALRGPLAIVAVVTMFALLTSFRPTKLKAFGYRLL